ncbi:FeoC-like transcriptional regulator [Vibrio kyushuensis]|uniref:FeoC-like transcriptional regulator n=1 Tax=Vibrio kyushuensis TaxID=2910249 RepID=UPI003D0BCC81
MILTELIEHITKNGTTSRQKLANRFAISEDGVDAMLEVWIKKGKISRINDTSKTGNITGVRYCSNPKDSLSMTVTM